MNRKFWTLSVLAVALAFGVMGCSNSDDDSNNGTGPEVEGNVFTLNASDYADWGAFSFSTDDSVSVADLTTSSEWDIAMRRVEIKLNSGPSGPKAIEVVDLTDQGFVEADTYDEITAIPTGAADAFTEETVEYVMGDEWYGYTGAPDHLTPATGKPYVMYTADSLYCKFRISKVVPYAMGTFDSLAVEFVLAPSGSQDISGDSTVITAYGVAGEDQFVDFSAGGFITVDDPSTNMDWDVWFDGYTAKVNGGVSGSANAGITPTTDTWENLTAADPNIDGVPNYESDYVTSPMYDWYDYAGPPTHAITSKNHIYLIKLEDGTVYKFQILAYVDPDTGEKAMITFQYDEIQ